MLVEEFTLNGKNRLDELKSYLLNNMPSATFRKEPFYDSKKDIYEISIRYDIKDAIKLDELHKRWAQKDTPQKRNNNNLLKKNY